MRESLVNLLKLQEIDKGNQRVAPIANRLPQRN